MIRLVVLGLALLGLFGPFSGAARAVTDFRDVPFLQTRINQVLERQPTGAEVEWRNEATGNSGVIRVLRTYFPTPGSPCREYERTSRQPSGPDGLVQGTGCRDASGRWRLKEKEEAAKPPPSGSSASGSPPTGSSPAESSASGSSAARSQPPVAPAPETAATEAAPPGEVTAATSILPDPPKPVPAPRSPATEAPERAAEVTETEPPGEFSIELPTRSD